MGFLTWIGQSLLSLVVNKIWGAVRSWWAKNEARKADHSENAQQAKEDTTKLEGIKDETDPAKVDEAIRDSLRHF